MPRPSITGLKATIQLFLWELESLPEYSTSVPTGVTTWKMWKRNIAYVHCGAQYIVGQYVPCDSNNGRDIRWFEVLLKEGPKPRDYVAPDWSNYQRWKKDRATVLREELRCLST